MRTGGRRGGAGGCRRTKGPGRAPGGGSGGAVPPGRDPRTPAAPPPPPRPGSPAPARPGLRGKIVAAADYLDVAPTVVRVARDIALPELDAKLPASPVDPERLLALAETWNLAGPTRRLVDAMAR